MKRGLKLKGMLRLYLKWPLFLSILFIIMDIQLFVINRRIGVIGAVYCVIFILITLILIFFGKKMESDVIWYNSRRIMERSNEHDQGNGYSLCRIERRRSASVGK